MRIITLRLSCVQTLLLGALVLLVLSIPHTSDAYGYSEGYYYGYGYGQGYYYGYAYSYSYSQAYYYAYSYSQAYYYGYAYGYSQGYYQGSYTLTFSDSVAVKGNVAVTSNLGKGSGTFVIDHPLYPLEKLLFHSFLESPDAKNIYDGVAVLNGDGEATVELPDYFEALNKDFRYQLKPIGAPMPDLHVKQEVENNQFRIGGGKPGGRVSWQVTGTRHDPYIEANPIIVEVEKGPDEFAQKGEYLFPEGYSPSFPATLFTSLLGNLGDLFKPLFGI